MKARVLHVLALFALAAVPCGACGKKNGGKTAGVAGAAGAAPPLLRAVGRRSADRARREIPGRLGSGSEAEAKGPVAPGKGPRPMTVVRRSVEGNLQNERDGADLVWIPEGFYPQGREGGRPEETPPHEVFLEGFYIYRCEVTRAMFARFRAATQNGAGDESEDPAWPHTAVTWEEARAYARWAGGDLPSEARWEAAARGPGVDQFPWGDAPADAKRCNCAGIGPGSLLPVGTLPAGASPFGCLDMAGNAAEWCLDAFHADAYEQRMGLTKEPLDTRPSPSRVVRGGGVFSPPDRCTVTGRIGLDPGMRLEWLGFRVVLVPGKAEDDAGAGDE